MLITRGILYSLKMMNCTEIVKSYLSAFESADPEEIASHVSTGFENDQVGVLGASFKGRDLYRQRLVEFLQRFKNLRYTIEEMIEADNRVAVAYIMNAEDDGRLIEIRGAMIIFISDGLITRRSDYWDGLSYQQQLGMACD